MFIDGVSFRSKNFLSHEGYAPSLQFGNFQKVLHEKPIHLPCQMLTKSTSVKSEIRIFNLSFFETNLTKLPFIMGGMFDCV